MKELNEGSWYGQRFVVTLGAIIAVAYLFILLWQMQDMYNMVHEHMHEMNDIIMPELIETVRGG